MTCRFWRSLGMRVFRVGVVLTCAVAQTAVTAVSDTRNETVAWADDASIRSERPLATAAERRCEFVTIERALDAVRQRYMDAFNRGDANAVAALHTAESVSMPAGRPTLVGRESIQELMEESLSGVPEGFRFEFEPIDVRIADGWATERGVTKGGGEISSGKYVMLYEREADDCWRIAWTITNTDVTPPPR